jgi:hypothetical protein
MESTFNGLSQLYNKTSYEIDLFDIFKYISLFDKLIASYKLKDENIDSKQISNFHMEVFIKIIDFKLKYGTSFIYESLSIKNKIMMISILRKLNSIIKGNCYNYYLDINNNMFYFINKLTEIFQ